MRIVFDDIKESLAPNFKGGEKSFASRAFSDGQEQDDERQTHAGGFYRYAQA